jgi:TPR repeat protein
MGRLPGSGVMCKALKDSIPYKSQRKSLVSLASNSRSGKVIIDGFRVYAYINQSMASSKSRDTSNPEEFSTTLRIGLVGRIFYLACHQHERFRIGSADDCKLAIDGEGIANEHCEIERVDETHFIVRALGIASLDVTYEEYPHGVATPSRVTLRKDGVAPSEVSLLSPFGIEFGSLELSIAVVPDSEADGFEEVMINRDNTPAPYVLTQRRKKNSSRGEATPTTTSRAETDPALGRNESAPVEADLVPVQADLVPAQTDLVPAQTDLVPAQTDLVPAQTDLVPAQTEPVTDQTVPVTAQAEPVTAQTEPVTDQAEPDIDTVPRRARSILPSPAMPVPRSGHYVDEETKGAAKEAMPFSLPVNVDPVIPPEESGQAVFGSPVGRGTALGSSKLLIPAALSLCLILAVGFGWFALRKPTSLSDRVDLYKKVEAGDFSAMATLGLSLVRGERAAGLEIEEGIRLIKASAQAGDPFGHLALGWLHSEGYAALPSLPVDAKEETSNPEWRIAIELGLEEKAAESDDPRWWSLTCLALKAVQGKEFSKSQALLEKASELGDLEATLLLAENASTSLVRTQWLQRLDADARSAANADSVFASRLLGELHAVHDYEKADPEFGRKQLEEAADRGDPVAQLYLADYHDEQKQPEIAFQRTHQAADTGFLPAKTALAERYLHGIGTDAQPYLAVTLATEAMTGGDKDAVRVLALAYAEGKGAEPDLDRAIGLLQDLADRGDRDASVALGKLLDKAGRGHEGVSYLRPAAETGDLEAAYNLGLVLIKSNLGADQEEAARWLEKVAVQGSEEAMSSDAISLLADHLDSPDREIRNPERVVQLLQPRAEAGDHKSALRLCEYLITGRAIAADPLTALNLAKKASAAGETRAFFQLGELYEKGAGTQKPDPVAALREYQKALAAGDERIFERFPGLIDGKQVVSDFVASWSQPSPSVTTAYLAESVEAYFHLNKPDAALIGSLESGLRQVWPDRSVEVKPAQSSTLEALDHIRVSLPYEFLFSLDEWWAGGDATAMVDLRQQPDGSWKISSFRETDQNWSTLEPKRENFELRNGALANSRSVFPVILPEDTTYDDVKLPNGQVFRVKALPFSDKFGNGIPLLPISVRGDLIVFSRLSTGGEILLPSAHFESESLESFSTMIDEQSADVFKGFADQLVSIPNSRDPRTASLMASANRGDHESEALVGESYYDGFGGFPVNRVEALKWFLKSARGEDPLGRLWIALMAEKDGIQVSGAAHDFYNEALPRLNALVARPDAKGHHVRAYVECWFGLHNISLHAPEQRELLERAIAAGDLRAKLLLGDSLLTSNISEGIGYVRDARDGGCATAGKALAKYYLGPGNDPRLAPALLRTAAKKHDPEAQIMLSERLAETDPMEAALWLQLGLQNAVQLKDEVREAQARQAIDGLKSIIGEDRLERAKSFLEDKNIRLGQ